MAVEATRGKAKWVIFIAESSNKKVTITLGLTIHTLASSSRIAGQGDHLLSDTMDTDSQYAL